MRTWDARVSPGSDVAFRWKKRERRGSGCGRVGAGADGAVAGGAVAVAAARFRFAIVGVRDARVEHAAEGVAEAFRHFAELAEGQVAVIELPVGDALADDVGDELLDLL